eukprot:5727431-Alexandrium_andersonii.AAC.1
MSASLVGSEMCIRDSRSGAATPQQSVRRCTMATRPSARVRRERSVRPVSYTHLTLPTICSV